MGIFDFSPGSFLGILTGAQPGNDDPSDYNQIYGAPKSQLDDAERRKALRMQMLLGMAAGIQQSPGQAGLLANLANGLSTGANIYVKGMDSMGIGDNAAQLNKLPAGLQTSQYWLNILHDPKSSAQDKQIAGVQLKIIANAHVGVPKSWIDPVTKQQINGTYDPNTRQYFNPDGTPFTNPIPAVDSSGNPMPTAPAANSALPTKANFSWATPDQNAQYGQLLSGLPQDKLEQVVGALDSLGSVRPKASAGVSAGPGAIEEAKQAGKNAADIAANPTLNQQKTDQAVAETSGVAGAKLAIERKAEYPQALQGFKDNMAGIGQLSTAIQKLANMPGLNKISGGLLGAYLDNPDNARKLSSYAFLGQDGKDALAQLDFIRNKIGLQTIMNMKQQSKTGATGFGQLSDKEGEMIRGALANLSTAQSGSSLANQLKDVAEQLKGSVQRQEEGFHKMYDPYVHPEAQSQGAASPKFNSYEELVKSLKGN